MRARPQQPHPVLGDHSPERQNASGLWFDGLEVVYRLLQVRCGDPFQTIATEGWVGERRQARSILGGGAGVRVPTPPKEEAKVLTIIQSGSKAWAMAATNGDVRIFSREQAGEWIEVLLSEESEQLDGDGSLILEALYEQYAGEEPEEEGEEPEAEEEEEDEEPQTDEEDEEPEEEEDEEPEEEDEEPEEEDEEPEEEEDEKKPRRSRRRTRAKQK